MIQDTEIISPHYPLLKFLKNYLKIYSGQEKKKKEQNNELKKGEDMLYKQV